MPGLGDESQIGPIDRATQMRFRLVILSKRFGVLI